MTTRPLPSEPCHWASQRLSLRLDGEISEFEQLRLDEHLRSCADCRARAAELGTITEALRAAELEEPRVAFQLPRRHYVGAYALRAVSATAAVAVMAISGLVGLSGFRAPNGSRQRTPAAEVRAAHERMAVKEQQLDQLETAGRSSRTQIRPGLAAVEQISLGPQTTSTNGIRKPTEGR